jgi:hypothetical protein
MAIGAKVIYRRGCDRDDADGAVQSAGYKQRQ